MTLAMITGIRQPGADGGLGAAGSSVPSQGLGSSGSELTGYLPNHGLSIPKTLVSSPSMPPAFLDDTLLAAGLWWQMHRT